MLLLLSLQQINKEKETPRSMHASAALASPIHAYIHTKGLHLQTRKQALLLLLLLLLLLHLPQQQRDPRLEAAKPPTRTLHNACSLSTRLQAFPPAAAAAAAGCCAAAGSRMHLERLQQQQHLKPHRAGFALPLGAAAAAPAAAASAVAAAGCLYADSAAGETPESSAAAQT